MKLWKSGIYQIVAMLLMVASTAATAQESSEVRTATSALKTVEVTNSLGEKMTMTTRRVSYLLGKNLGYQAALGARKVPQEKFADSMVMTKRFAEALEVELGEVPEVSDFGMIWDMLEFIGKGESGISGKIATTQGNECAALVRLSSMIMLAPSLYSNDFPTDEEAAKFQRKTNNYVKTVIGKSAVAAKFQNRKEILDALGPFFNKMDKEASVEEVGKLMLQTINGVDSLLDKELTKQTPQAESKNVDKSASDTAVRAFLQEAFAIDSAESARAFTLKLKPTKEACEAVLKPEFASRAFKVYDALFSDDSMMLSPKKQQTELRLLKLTSDQIISNDEAVREFPGGYRKLASKLNKGLTIYQFTFVEPGEDRGMRYDGLIQVGDDWFLFPKLWRIEDERPFGMEIPK